MQSRWHLQQNLGCHWMSQAGLERLADRVGKACVIVKMDTKLSITTEKAVAAASQALADMQLTCLAIMHCTWCLTVAARCSMLHLSACTATCASDKTCLSWSSLSLTSLKSAGKLPACTRHCSTTGSVTQVKVRHYVMEHKKAFEQQQIWVSTQGKGELRAEKPAANLSHCLLLTSRADPRLLQVILWQSGAGTAMYLLHLG